MLLQPCRHLGSGASVGEPEEYVPGVLDHMLDVKTIRGLSSTQKMRRGRKVSVSSGIVGRKRRGARLVARHARKWTLHLALQTLGCEVDVGFAPEGLARAERR